jgi:uncharacterized membrane protein YoaK (UPF0700 family)
MDGYMIGFIVMMVMIFAARMINEKAMKKLSTEEKGLLIDGFASNRNWSLGLIILLIAGYFAVIRFELVNVFVGLAVYVALLTVFLAVQIIASHRKLEELGLPSAYITSFKISSLLRVIGFVLFFLLSFLLDWR